MATFYQVRELANEDGTATGKFRYVSFSDEGSSNSMFPLCQHRHDSIEEATNCPDARAKLGPIFGRALDATPLPPPIEPLAAYAHESWSGWMTYMFSKSATNPDGSVTIPADLVARWERQRTTPYNALPESEQKSDRDEAIKILSVIDQAKEE